MNDLVDLIKARRSAELRRFGLLISLQDTVIISGDPAVLTANMENVDSPEIFVKFTEAAQSSQLEPLAQKPIIDEGC